MNSENGVFEDENTTILTDSEIMNAVKREGDSIFKPPSRNNPIQKKKLVPLFEEENEGLKKLARTCEDSKVFGNVVYETTIIRCAIRSFLSLSSEEQFEKIKQYQKIA